MSGLAFGQSAAGQASASFGVAWRVSVAQFTRPDIEPRAGELGEPVLGAVGRRLFQQQVDARDAAAAR